MNANVNELTKLVAVILVSGVFATVIIRYFLSKTLWGFRRRGIKDAKTGAARPFEEGWTSPFVRQLVQKYDHRLARLTVKSEHGMNRNYQKTSSLVADIEKLNSRKAILTERFEKSVTEETIPEIKARNEKNFYAMIEHIAYQQADLAKKMAKLRAGINTKRQKYIERLNAIINKRDEQIHAYWGGVAQRLDDAPVTPEYDGNMSEAHEAYLSRNDHVLETIDYYAETYLKPEDISNMKL